ncbi:hypothetical protein [Streptomyces bacillaris]|uniref:restriction endonuclease-related protein n=1 Tax=Streptomyces bacillaris TaxID=68179 RepID=UPI003461390A
MNARSTYVSSLHDAEVRHVVMTAAAMAARALTGSDSSTDPEVRLKEMMDAHARILWAWGPGKPLTFTKFREILTEDLSALLPNGVDAGEMSGFYAITGDGEFEEDSYDLEMEQRTVLEALEKASWNGRSAMGARVSDELHQTLVHRELLKGRSQESYCAWRSALIRTPAGPAGELRRLDLPAKLDEFYEPIRFDALYDQRWWFACPFCSWPMKITLHGEKRGSAGKVRCFHRPHARQGARYEFRVPDSGKAPELRPVGRPLKPEGNASVLFKDITDRMPEPTPEKGHRALVRGVWRCTTIPGIPELGLYDALSTPAVKKKGVVVALWPDMDTYDLLVTVTRKPGVRTEFKVDVKDYTYATLLADKITADRGDKGGADWLVVPDFRYDTVPMLEDVSRKWMRVATAGDFGARVCKEAGATWA